MLQELIIHNYAIIDALCLELHPGFNVLTGETGAGKSIIIDAVGALLGGKYGAEVVRTGAERAHIEGVFLLPPQPAHNQESGLWAILRAAGLEPDDGTLILSREIHRSGRSTCRVNGHAVPLSLLQQIGDALVDIHGQSDHLSLLRPGEHILILDRYAGLDQQRQMVAMKVSRLRAVRKDIAGLLADERELARRVDLLTYQIEEIASAHLRPGEEEELQRERTLLANAERLAALADDAYATLYGGSSDQPSATDLLGRAIAALADLARLDPSLDAHKRVAEDASYTLEDIARSLRAYRDAIEFNPQRLEDVEERLDLIQRLKRKYGPTIDDILAFGDRAARELASISHSEERVAELRREEADLVQEIGALAASLSQARQRAAQDLARRIEQELGDLNMPHVRFRVAVDQVAAPDGIPVGEGRYAYDTTGIDRVEFRISPNPGEPLKPLARIASGGEMARVMLAIKSILSQADAVPTLIFDEIDVGIGGRSGYVVGEKLWRLTRNHQVICVTHLPQVASYGDAHFSVNKVVDGDHTRAQVYLLEGDDRVHELAAMLGSHSELSHENAREILARAQEWKQMPQTLS
jgi:DNA repair protein RecN (Recombination protein N)